jgi:hypothetical protein
VLGLHSLKQDLPTIHGVEFVRESSGNYVRVNIEEDQPAGTYVGTVVDRESEKPIGTLHVRVLE